MGLMTVLRNEPVTSERTFKSFFAPSAAYVSKPRTRFLAHSGCSYPGKSITE